MTIAFVLGNGVSRRAVDLPMLAACGEIYGCNGLYREFAPTVLVSTDAPISEHIQNSGYSKMRTHYTRKPLPDSGALRIPKEYFGFSSGPAAAGIATVNHHRTVYLVGFDLGPNNTGKFNNVYADTEFYKKSSANPTYSGNWVRQLITVMNTNPKVTFYRVQGLTTADIAAFNSVKNLAHMPIADFLDRINNTKDL
jgi:hypothetical protein